MTNLLEETLNTLDNYDKIPEDVRYIVHRTGVCGWEDFSEAARTIDYDSGYGAQEILDDLLVVGDSWWLERAEYDGAENWVYKSMPNFTIDNAKPTKRDLLTWWDEDY